MEINDFIIDMGSFDRYSFHKSVFGKDADLNKSAQKLIEASDEITHEIYDMLLYQWCDRKGLILSEEEASKYPSVEDYLKENE